MEYLANIVLGLIFRPILYTRESNSLAAHLGKVVLVWLDFSRSPKLALNGSSFETTTEISTSTSTQTEGVTCVIDREALRLSGGLGSIAGLCYCHSA